MKTANDNTCAPAEWSHIEIDAGEVKAASITTDQGETSDPTSLSKFLFFVTAIDSEGGRLNLHDSEEYEDAIRLAENARIDFEIDFPVHDKVAGTH